MKFSKLLLLLVGVYLSAANYQSLFAEEEDVNIQIGQLAVQNLPSKLRNFDFANAGKLKTRQKKAYLLDLSAIRFHYATQLESIMSSLRRGYTPRSTENAQTFSKQILNLDHLAALEIGEVANLNARYGLERAVVGALPAQEKVINSDPRVPCPEFEQGQTSTTRNVYLWNTNKCLINFFERKESFVLPPEWDDNPENDPIKIEYVRDQFVYDWREFAVLPESSNQFTIVSPFYRKVTQDPKIYSKDCSFRIHTREHSQEWENVYHFVNEYTFDREVVETSGTTCRLNKPGRQLVSIETRTSISNLRNQQLELSEELDGDGNITVCCDTHELTSCFGHNWTHFRSTTADQPDEFRKCDENPWVVPAWTR